MVFLVSLKRDVARLLRLLEYRIEDLLFDLRVNFQLLFELREQLFACLDAALGGRLKFFKDAGNFFVILLQEFKCVHEMFSFPSSVRLE